jgi:ribosomal protein L18E
MAKTKATEPEEVRLKKKVAAKLAGHSNPEGDAAMRALRKRLKREQRKRRALALRKKNAGGSKPAEAAAPSAG